MLKALQKISSLFRSTDRTNGTSTVICRIISATVKVLVLSPILVKLCNQGMAGVDLIDQKTVAYRLFRKSKFTFLLKNIFWLNGYCLVDSDIAYKSLRILELRFANLKIIVANLLVCCADCKRSFPEGPLNKRWLLQ